MEERYVGRLEPGMDVCDLTGEKVGTVAQVYRYEVETIGAAGTAAEPDPEPRPAGDEILEVKSGFLGLGSHLYVPLGAIEQVTEAGVILAKPKEEFDSLGWHEKPGHLDRLH